MQTPTTEYLPSDHEGSPKKIFRLAPPERDYTSIILQSRRDVLEDGELSDGAKVLFTYLLDYSLHPGRNRGPGVVVFSTTQLSERLGRCARALYGWKRELVCKRYVWISSWYMPNTWPIDCFHITTLDPPGAESEMATPDGMWGNGTRRQRAGTAGLGARAVRRTECHRTNDPLTEGQNAQTVANEPAHRTDCQASAASYAADRRKLCGGEPHEMSPESRKLCGGPPHEQAVLKEARGTREETDQGGKASPPAKKTVEKVIKPDGGDLEAELEKWREGLTGQFPSRLEKLANRLNIQREQAATPAARSFLTRKLAMVRAILDGPKPPWEDPSQAAKPKPTVTAAMQTRPPTPEELLEGARYLVSIGKADQLTAQQRAALGQ